ncbi:MAG: M42 family peptidase, partial [Defluviitaleaceae bacterium]|nr:M42 family peptidase [Defluviitaleaceae bacterium]
MDTIKLIERLSNAFGPSGFEDDVVAVASHYAKGFADISESNIRNLYIRPRAVKGKPGRPPKNAKPVLMLDAHTDEVGFMVQAVMPNGLLKIYPLGGWVPSILPSSA